MTSAITLTWTDERVAIVTLDDPTQSVNTMNELFVSSLADTLDQIDATEGTTGIVITSAKKVFFAGGDLNDLRAARRENVGEFSAFVARNGDLLRRLERSAVPVVAAINGSALGGGLELALATHHRVVVSDPSLRLGLPEVTLGLLPGAGGVVRTVRMLGVAKALDELLLTGRAHTVASALALGIVDTVVGERDQLIPAALQWIADNPKAAQPWDSGNDLIPGGRPGDKSQPLHAMLPALTSSLRAKLKGAPYHAPYNILNAAVEGAQVDVDTALAIERRYFVDVALGPVAKNMIQANFFDMRAVRGLRGRDEGHTPSRVERVVVLGAGMMGAGIAYQCAISGIDVVLKDVTRQAADRGKAYSEKLIASRVKRGTLDAAAGDAILARITPADNADAAAGADLVIEAVFEDPALKASVLAEVEPVLAPNALIGSNTSTLPITGLSKNVGDPSRFIGLHFFSPVDKMPLLEIILGEETSDESLSRALDFARQISKTPIVVHDSRGFFTSRVIGTFINEALAMLSEGVPAPTIEQATLQAGYPAPALQLTDELNLELLRRVRDTGRDAASAEGRSWAAHPADDVVDTMLTKYERAGRLAGAGFYDYDGDGRRTGLWSGLTEAFPVMCDDGRPPFPMRDLVDRMLYIEAIESMKCVDEGVVRSTADANVGSLLGIGYPGWTGGVLQFIDGHEGGVAGFVARADELRARYGGRFEVPGSLRAIADADGSVAGAVEKVT